eukprot:gene2670-3089_t
MNRYFDSARHSWIPLHPKGEAFAEYFETHKLPLIKNTMSVRIRTAADLGYPPDVCTQNVNKCGKSPIKSQLKGKKLSFTEAALTIHACVRGQQTDVRLAMFGNGEYRVDVASTMVAVNCDEYYAMSSKECAEHCMRHSAYKICSHTIAVAKKCGRVRKPSCHFQ